MARVKDKAVEQQIRRTGCLVEVHVPPAAMIRSEVKHDIDTLDRLFDQRGVLQVAANQI